MLWEKQLGERPRRKKEELNETRTTTVEVQSNLFLTTTPPSERVQKWNTRHGINGRIKKQTQKEWEVQDESEEE